MGESGVKFVDLSAMIVNKVFEQGVRGMGIGA